VVKRDGKEQGAGKNDSMRKKLFFIKEDEVCGVRSTNERDEYIQTRGKQTQDVHFSPWHLILVGPQ